MITRTPRRCRFAPAWMVLSSLVAGATASAEEVVWRASRKTEVVPAVRLGRPQASDDLIVRAQGPEMAPLTPSPPPPPPPPPPGAASPFPGAVPAGEDAYNCGVVNTKSGHVGGFFQRLRDGTRRAWDNMTTGIGGAFQSGPGRAAFQSDRCFEVFASPVTNPFYFTDPRSLTEFRPTFMWQVTPGSNPAFAGSNNYFLNLGGSVAITDRFSVTFNRLGFVHMDGTGAVPGFSSDTGFSEIHLGPKFTFIRNDTSNTLAALGLVFEIPIGSGDVQQSNGDLTLRPYFSFAQNFWRSDYGSFNFMNTTGYAFSVDSERTDFLFSSFHLDYEIAKKFYPLIELNYTLYTVDGDVNNITFEGHNLFNFGARDIAGQSDLTIAGGFRYKVNDNWWIGLAGETSLLSGGSHLDRFRLTFDMIFRY